MLTQEQFETLDTINAFLKEHGVPPTFRQLTKALGFKSTSGVHVKVTALREAGLVVRDHRGRIIPATHCATCGQKLREASHDGPT